jgi:hypothetical protein
VENLNGLNVFFWLVFKCVFICYCITLNFLNKVTDGSGTVDPANRDQLDIIIDGLKENDIKLNVMYVIQVCVLT